MNSSFFENVFSCLTGEYEKELREVKKDNKLVSLPILWKVNPNYTMWRLLLKKDINGKKLPRLRFTILQKHTYKLVDLTSGNKH